jgi:hypothetical protein
MMGMAAERDTTGTEVMNEAVIMIVTTGAGVAEGINWNAGHDPARTLCKEPTPSQKGDWENWISGPVRGIALQRLTIGNF